MFPNKEMFLGSSLSAEVFSSAKGGYFRWIRCYFTKQEQTLIQRPAAATTLFKKVSRKIILRGWGISLTKSDLFALDPTPKRNLIWERRIPPQSEFIVTLSLVEYTGGWDPTPKRISSEGLMGYKIHNSIQPPHHHHNTLGLCRTRGFAAGKKKYLVGRAKPTAWVMPLCCAWTKQYILMMSHHFSSLLTGRRTLDGWATFDSKTLNSCTLFTGRSMQVADRNSSFLQLCIVFAWWLPLR